MLYADLVPEVLPDVLGCPDFAIERAIRDSAVEFFDSSLAYTVEQDPQPVYAGLDVVDLDIPTGTRLVQLLRAQIGRRSLERISRDDLYSSGRNWKTESGLPVAVTFDSETAVRLLPTADQSLSDSLYLRFAVTPKRTSTSIPDELGERYFREIVFGAKAVLMMSPGQVWSNPQLGLDCRAMFERGMREAKLTVAQDGIAGQRQVRIRRVV